jgi:thiamine pyrophosphate-dependent acetolactate synthase large subunit-like protein
VTADQYACTAAVLDRTPDAAVVSNLGVASYVLAAVEDRARNVYLWGSMGVTTPVGLGLALAVDDPVTVLDGDGSMLMSLGALSTVGGVDPSNLAVVVFDNGGYETTGGQPSHGATTDTASVAEACGLAAWTAETDDGFAAAYDAAVAHDGAALVDCAVAPVDPDERPPFDFAHVTRRAREALAAE